MNLEMKYGNHNYHGGNHYVPVIQYIHIRKPDIVSDSSLKHYQSLHQKVQSIFTEKVGIVRHEAELYRAVMEIDKLIEEVPRNSSDVFVKKIRDMLILARSIVKSALYREESRGAHQRSNFPDSSADYHGHVVLKNSKIKFEMIDENGE